MESMNEISTISSLILPPDDTMQILDQSVVCCDRVVTLSMRLTGITWTVTALRRCYLYSIDSLDVGLNGLGGIDLACLSLCICFILCKKGKFNA